MKKVVLGLLVSFLIISATSPAQAAIQKTIRIPTILQGATESIQKVIATLISKTDNHEARIVELEKKVKVLEERVAKLEANTLINDENSNIQPTQGLKESSEAIPLNQLQQDSSSLNQKISDFISSSSDHIEANQVIDLNTNIKDLGDVKLR